MYYFIMKDYCVPVSCNKDCGAGCALTAYVKEGKLEKVTDSADKLPYMKGCLKGYRTAETVYHKDRLLHPMIRTGMRGTGKFRRASWEEALKLISSKLQNLREDNNCSSLMRLGGSGSCRGALHNTDLVTRRFLSLYGDYTDTTGNYSSEASSFVKQPVFGTKYVGIDGRTLLNSEYIILWGFNPWDTRFDCEIESILTEAAEKGIPITVIDPRKTRTVSNLKAEWLPVKPGTDSAFMLAILWILIEERLIRRDFLQRYSSGFDLLEKYILGETDGIEKSPEWAEKICGISVEKIKKFTRKYAASSRAALLPGLSLQRAIGGENTDRLGAVLQLATGNTGKVGGSSGASKWNKLPTPQLGKLPVPENKSVKRVPVYLWADAVLEGKSGGFPSDISFIYNVGGNYIGQGSDTTKTVQAFEKAAFSVTHDYFMTETAAYSDIILPVTTFIEREDIISTQNNYIFYSAKAITPPGMAQNDFWIFSRLAEELGFFNKYTENRTEDQWLDFFLSQSEIEDIEGFKRKGFYSGKGSRRIALAEFIADPERYPLQTPSGKIEIACEELRKQGGTLLPEHINFSPSEKYPLRMISPHEKYRIHSQNDNIPSLKKLCDDRLWINICDAESRSINDEDPVKISSHEGFIRSIAFVTEKISEGTVSLNQGSWAENVNYLTSTIPTLPSKGSRTHSILVNVTK
ncbi:MAG: molybdopterin-dependent oxidoreductase [Spirochaetaceae bacterium]|nr:molybdopterin-dependent oxidoreductase [Spirochaetaceae bacterium]